MNKSSNIFENLRVPEMWLGGDAPEIIPYCIDVTTFALKKLDEWKFPVRELDAPGFQEHEVTLVICWNQAMATLKELASLAECLDGVDDLPSDQALVTATETTLNMLQTFCGFAFTLTSAVTNVCCVYPDGWDVQKWSVTSARDAVGLLEVTIKLLEIRSHLPTPSEEATAEEPAVA